MVYCFSDSDNRNTIHICMVCCVAGIWGTINRTCFTLCSASAVIENDTPHMWVHTFLYCLCWQTINPTWFTWSYRFPCLGIRAVFWKCIIQVFKFAWTHNSIPESQNNFPDKANEENQSKLCGLWFLMHRQHRTPYAYAWFIVSQTHTDTTTMQICMVYNFRRPRRHRKQCKYVRCYWLSGTNKPHHNVNIHGLLFRRHRQSRKQCKYVWFEISQTPIYHNKSELTMYCLLFLKRRERRSRNNYVWCKCSNNDKHYINVHICMCVWFVVQRLHKHKKTIQLCRVCTFAYVWIKHSQSYMYG